MSFVNIGLYRIRCGRNERTLVNYAPRDSRWPDVTLSLSIVWIQLPRGSERIWETLPL